jgi:hypothetical protein
MKKMIALLISGVVIGQLIFPINYAKSSSKNATQLSTNRNVDEDYIQNAIEEVTSVNIEAIVGNEPAETEESVSRKERLALVQEYLKAYNLRPNQLYKTSLEGDLYFTIYNDKTYESIHQNIADELRENGIPVFDVPYKFDPKEYETLLALHNIPTNQIYKLHDYGTLFLFLHPNGKVEWLPEYEAVTKKIPITWLPDILVNDSDLKPYSEIMSLQNFPKNTVYRINIGSLPRYVHFDNDENVQLISKNQIGTLNVKNYDQMPINENILDEIKHTLNNSGVATDTTYRIMINNHPQHFSYNSFDSVHYVRKSDLENRTIVDFEEAVKELEVKKREEERSATTMKWAGIGAVIGIIFYFIWRRKNKR